MKRKYMMLYMMISRPRQPRNDIHVYLSPLIEDFKFLWDQGVDVFDAYEKVNFNLCALLFCTINDFPTNRNLSDYSVKGHSSYPIYEENTSYHQLKHGRKTSYIGPPRFMKRNHPYHRVKKVFNGSWKDKIVPPALIGVKPNLQCQCDFWKNIE